MLPVFFFLICLLFSVFFSSAEANPPPICKSLKIVHVDVQFCLKFSDVSLAKGHAGACLDVDAKAAFLHFSHRLGCFYGDSLGTNEKLTMLAIQPDKLVASGVAP